MADLVAMNQFESDAERRVRYGHPLQGITGRCTDIVQGEAALQHSSAGQQIRARRVDQVGALGEGGFGGRRAYLHFGLISVRDCGHGRRY